MKSTYGCFFRIPMSSSLAPNRPMMSPFWLGCWAITLSLGWLLPNHYRPWLSLHADVWVASALLLSSALVILRTRGSIAWHRITVILAVPIATVWLQYGIGLVVQPGVAWIYSLYLFGFLLALLIGARWEASSPGQLADGLFIAIGFAAIMSIGLQLRQWFQLDGLELWVMGGDADRPYANLGQPNQLGTLLLWGILAAVWGVVRQCIGAWTALLMVAYLLFGIALTESRTAWIGVFLLVAASWIWRGLWTSKQLPWIATAMAIYFLACIVVLGWPSKFPQGTLDLSLFSDVTRMTSEVRPLAWTTLLDAAWQRPWFGYGWGQVALAQMAVATDHPHLGAVFSYAHNLFLDLVLWLGIPLGLFFSLALLSWFYKAARAVSAEQDVVLLMLLLVVGNHAMLELPLYYGYFLLPIGLVVGALNVRLGGAVWLKASRWVLVGLWLIATMFLALIVRDYTRVEPSYQLLRMEWQGFKITKPREPPDVLLLTQWRDYVRMARIEPRAGLRESDLNDMRSGIVLSPNPLIFHKLATSMALNQQPEEARLWLQRMCKVVSLLDCDQVRKVWAKQALKYPEIAAIPWPVEETGP